MILDVALPSLVNRLDDSNIIEIIMGIIIIICIIGIIFFLRNRNKRRKNEKK